MPIVDRGSSRLLAGQWAGLLYWIASSTRRRQIDGVEQMRFDYKMRSGVTPTTNALKLLEMVGLSKKTQWPG
jgi:hypothetical protein